MTEYISWAKSMDIVKQHEQLHILRRRTLYDEVLNIEHAFRDKLEELGNPQDVRQLSGLAFDLVDFLQEEETANMWRKAAIVTHLREHWGHYQKVGAIDATMSFSRWAESKWNREYLAWMRAYKDWVKNDNGLAWIEAYDPEDRVRVQYGKVSRVSTLAFRALETFKCSECGVERNGPGVCPECESPTRQVGEHIANALLDEHQKVNDVRRAIEVSESEFYAYRDLPWTELKGRQVILHRPLSTVDAVCQDCGVLQVYGVGQCSDCNGMLVANGGTDVAVIEVLQVNGDMIAAQWQERMLSAMNVRR